MVEQLELGFTRISCEERAEQATDEAYALANCPGGLTSFKYIRLALLHGRRDLAHHFAEISGTVPNWGDTIHVALVSELGIRACLYFVYLSGDKLLAYHLSINHEKELTERHKAILRYVVLFNQGTRTAMDLMLAPKYFPDRREIRGILIRSRLAHKAEQSRRRRRMR